MLILKQGTEVSISLGPFVDATDGVTPETGLHGSMTVKLSKAGSAFSARNSLTAITDRTEGWYTVPLDTTDTGTLGELTIQVTSPGTHLPVFLTAMVVNADTYDNMISSNIVTAVSNGVLSSNADTGVTVQKALELLIAVFGGRVTNSGGTITYYDRGGLPVLAITPSTDGSRSSQGTIS